MKSILQLTIASALCAALSACATTAPTAAEVCSSEWIKPRTERAMASFKKETGSAMDTLRKASDSVIDNKNIGMFQMLAISNSVSKLSNTFTNGQSIKDLKTVAKTCNDPDLIKTVMTDFMRDQGIPDQMINMLSNFEVYRNLIETQVGPITLKS